MIIYPEKILLGFNFYGSGNVGDDLMLDGFLRAVPLQNLEGWVDRSRLPFLRARFNRIAWKAKGEDIRDGFDAWVGVGDTPIQAKSGTWFLRYMEREFAEIRRDKTRIFLVNVGAEQEVERFRDSYKALLDQCDFISTRDQDSYEILKNRLGIRSDILVEAADLANISLSVIFNDAVEERETAFDLGVNFFRERHSAVDLVILAHALRKLVGECNILMFGNEVRWQKRSEIAVYTAIAPFVNFCRSARRLQYFMPNYFSRSVAELVAHYLSLETVVSSRYHALLTAAWAGCRVCAISRSSKIEALCRDLDIPIVEGLVTERKLREAKTKATRVARERLLKLERKARVGCERFLSQLQVGH